MPILSFLPDWAPNVHPLVVHFPIAVLTATVLVDLVALFVRRHTLHATVAGLYALGALGAVAAYLTGQAAADTVNVPPDAVATLAEHSDWAWRTVWFFGLYAMVRLAGLFWAPLRGALVHAVLVLVAAGGLYLVWTTGEHGGELVFAHGVGVQVEAPVAEAVDADGAGTGLQVQEDGSWRWVPGEEPDTALAEDVDFLEGTPEELDAEAISTPARGPALALTLEDRTILLAIGEPIQNVRAETRVDLSDFEGRLELVHHLQDPDTYDFLAAEADALQQGRVRGGATETFDTQPLDSRGWLHLQVVSRGTHFLGYVGDEMITHGHGTAPEAGRVGLRLTGSGTVRLADLRATPVDE